MNEYYRFNEQDARRFADHIHARTNHRGNELIFAECPYCHGSSKDNKNKFSISLNTGQFHCKRASCGVRGNMITLAKDFGFDLGTDVQRYYGIQRDQFAKPRKIPEHIDTDAMTEYFRGRGISKETVAKYHIKDDGNDVLAIPFINTEQKIECVKYRKMHFDKEKDSNKEWFAKNCKPILFGMGQCEDFETLVITEGQMDAMALAEAGIRNAVSVPNGANGFTWIPFCWDWVNKFKKIVCFGDFENEHFTLVDEITERFCNKDIYQVREINYQGYKDANEILQNCGKDALIEAVNQAEMRTTDDAIDMADVGILNIQDMEKVSTGYEALDKTLGGGLCFGTLTILTGKRGDGKSTFGSQLIANFLNQGEKTFIYSGELINEMTKAWLVQQMSGMPRADEQTLTEINNALRGNAFMFNCQHISDEETDIPELIEKAVQKYGCRCFLIDNLMSAISAENNVYDKQAEFVRKLANMGKKYNIAIILVAHPKKGDSGDSNDNISGHSNITDRADYVIKYCRAENDPPYVRLLEVSKNRLTGRLMLKDDRQKVFFNERNRRITETEDEEIKYRWMVSADVTEEDEECEIPF